MLPWIFWISTLLVVYTYVGYPAVVDLLSRLSGRTVQKAPILPRVTVITAAYNEAAHIRATILNKLEQDYPPDRLDVIIVSDDSNDGTDAIVKQISGRVRLIRQSPRAGKTAALNLAVPEASGEIIVFADANSIYAPDAVRRLVMNFADPDVGYVTGKMVYVTADGSRIGDGCTAYMRYENWLRARESKLASVIGVDGGIDAIRKKLYREMRADQLPDFVLPLSVAERGWRVIFEPQAILQEHALTHTEDEYRMRVRVALRAMWALSDMRHLLNPLRYGLLSAQLISHKSLRYFAFIPLLALLVTSIALASSGRLYTVAAVGQLALYSLALAGWTMPGIAMPKAVKMAYYFCLLNFACVHAAVKFFNNQRQATWTPRVG